MIKVDWPAPEKRRYIGKRISRVDGPAKTTGAAKYSYDMNPKGLLWAKLVTSPHALAQVVSVDTTAAAALPGVKATWKDDDIIGKDAQYVGQIIAAVAAETEEIANEAARLVQVKYQPRAHQVMDDDAALSKDNPSKREAGSVDSAFAKADVTHEGEYRIPVITHCCLEPHGQVTDVRGDELHVWPSTQNVSRYSDKLGETIGIEQSKIHVDCQYMGGGFGSKFNFDKWCTISALMSKAAGRPVKLMLERDVELMTAGNRPSATAKVKIAADKEGKVTAVQAEVWGSGGLAGYNPPPIPYVFTKIPNTHLVGRGIRTNRGAQRAWRAPNHPQGCFITMSAMADVAAKLRMDELDFFMKNLDQTDRPEVYREELQIAADLINYKAKKHLRGDSSTGSVRRGLGVSIHTWGGRGHPSDCDVTINPDGSVEAKIGTQDLGTGTRTTIPMVIAETLGIPFDAVKLYLGKNSYPVSGASGGSTTIGGVSVASRKASVDAGNALLEVVAPKLKTTVDALEIVDGQIRQADNPSNAISWKEACALLGPNPITKRGSSNPPQSEKDHLLSAGVGGAQIADVSVDLETGVVSLNELVAVQDCGLIIDLKTCESQVFGALIMGVTWALFEEAVYDAKSGKMLNADMEFYRLAGLVDVGKLKVHMMQGPEYEKRGVIGIGEPPAVSPGAAIANAVANACGVRVPTLPLTPDRVISALQKGGVIA